MRTTSVAKNIMLSQDLIINKIQHYEQIIYTYILFKMRLSQNNYWNYIYINSL